MKRYLQILLGLILTALLIIFALVRIAFEVIGASTAPDDFALLKQRMPKLLEWLFTTPWGVPTVIILVTFGVAAWLLFNGLRGVAVDPPVEALSRDEVEKMIASSIPKVTTRPAPEPSESWRQPFQDMNRALNDLKVVAMQYYRQSLREELTTTLENYLDSISGENREVRLGLIGSIARHEFREFDKRLTAAGVDLDAIRNAEERQFHEFENNALYFRIEESETKYWSDTKSKIAWLKRRAQASERLAALKRMSENTDGIEAALRRLY